MVNCLVILHEEQLKNMCWLHESQRKYMQVIPQLVVAVRWREWLGNGKLINSSHIVLYSIKPLALILSTRLNRFLKAIPFRPSPPLFKCLHYSQLWILPVAPRHCTWSPHLILQVVILPFLAELDQVLWLALSQDTHLWKPPSDLASVGSMNLNADTLRYPLFCTRHRSL